MRQPETARYPTAVVISLVSCRHARGAAVLEDLYPVRRAGRPVVVAPPERMDESNAGVTAPIVSRVLSLSGVDRLVPIHPSLEAATAASPPAAVGALPARQRIALGHLDDTIRQIRGTAFTTPRHGTSTHPAPPNGAAAARSGPRQPGRPVARAGPVEQEPPQEAAT
jgi:hypothetical protein